MTTQLVPSVNLTRRETIAGALGATALTVASPGLANGQSRRPNFLFIMADDLGYADLSCYGRREYQTTELDKLAAQGMRFTHGYASSAVCSATRVALITGRYQYRLPVGLEEPLSGRDLGLPPEVPSLPSLLQKQGYHTALIGKWHLGKLPKFDPHKSGYDEFWGNRGGGVDYFRHALGEQDDLWDNDVKIEESGYYTDLLADRSIGFLETRAQDDKPWLLSLHFTAPHWPWQADNAAGRAESERLAEKVARPGNPAEFHFDGGDMETYAEMVLAMDSNIGRLLRRLSELGMEQDTVVVFTSDNGGERFSDNWPFTGVKTELLEGGIRVPLIVKWPGVTLAGSESDWPVASIDFLPTFLAATGGAPDPAFPSDGVDIRPALTGGRPPDRTLYWRFSHKDQKAVRRGSYKYLSINGNEFLFDVVADPLERANLKARMPDRFAEMKAVFSEWNAEMLSDPDASTHGFSPEELADHFGLDS